MKMEKSMKNPDDKRFWEFVDKTAREVEAWPQWMKGGEPTGKQEAPAKSVESCGGVAGTQEPSK
jgi:hypothetical protein